MCNQAFSRVCAWAETQNIRQKNKNGYYAIDQTLSTSIYPDYTQGQVLMVKFVKTKV